MGDEGLLPDNQLLSSVARAIATFNADFTSDTNISLSPVSSFPRPQSSSQLNQNGTVVSSSTLVSSSTVVSNGVVASSSSTVTATVAVAAGVSTTIVSDPHHAVNGGVEISPSEVWALQYYQWESMYKGEKSYIYKYIFHHYYLLLLFVVSI